jgi:hypothetical protein
MHIRGKSRPDLRGTRTVSRLVPTEWQQDYDDDRTGKVPQYTPFSAEHDSSFLDHQATRKEMPSPKDDLGSPSLTCGSINGCYDGLRSDALAQKPHAKKPVAPGRWTGARVQW